MINDNIVQKEIERIKKINNVFDNVLLSLQKLQKEEEKEIPILSEWMKESIIKGWCK